MPRRESLPKSLCAHSATSTSKKKDLVQDRNKQLGRRADARSVSLNSDADRRLQANVPFSSRAFDRLRLFSLFLAHQAQPVSQEDSCCTETVVCSCCRFALQFGGMFLPRLVKKLIFQRNTVWQDSSRSVL